ncbi:MAG: hypothetical protein V4580_14555 [Bacteroidota bacterium]
MKKITLLLSTLLVATFAQAQDIITRNDSTKILANVLEVNPTEVKYHLYRYETGPHIILLKSTIAYITYSNGAVDRFSNEVAKPLPKYDPDKYNFDKVPVSSYKTEEDKKKRCEKLYTRKNYIGFNYIAFLNTCMAFNYMRDVKKANLIINVPFAVGMGSPALTNSLYGRNYLDGTQTTKYDRLNYQVGLNALFAPSMTREVNFLMGPAFNLSEYRVSVNTQYTTKFASSTIYLDGQFKNQFTLRREHYGINIGALARISQKVNMHMLITFGYKKDTYDQNDPYGIEAINRDAKKQVEVPYNVMPYVNFAWSVGYRF